MIHQRLAEIQHWVQAQLGFGPPEHMLTTGTDITYNLSPACVSHALPLDSSHRATHQFSDKVI